MTPFDRTFSA